MRDTPQNRRQLILFHHQSGIKHLEISKAVNVPKSTVSDILRKFTTTKNIESGRKNNGRKRKLRQRTENSLARMCRLNPKFTTKQIQKHVGGVATSVSVSTIKRTQKLKGFTAYRAMKSTKLN